MIRKLNFEEITSEEYRKKLMFTGDSYAACNVNCGDYYVDITLFFERVSKGKLRYNFEQSYGNYYNEKLEAAYRDFFDFICFFEVGRFHELSHLCYEGAHKTSYHDILHTRIGLKFIFDIVEEDLNELKEFLE